MCLDESSVVTDPIFKGLTAFFINRIDRRGSVLPSIDSTTALVQVLLGTVGLIVVVPPLPTQEIVIREFIATA